MFPVQYNPKEVEKKLALGWNQQGIYHWNEEEPRENNFSIDTPPPTVSGVLHMGHIFSYTQTDFIARYQRMIGKNVFYPMGFDDNGLPTERLVEKVKKVRANQMPRAEFVKLCEEVVAEAESEYKDICQAVAFSVDWKQEYQTVNATSRKISQMSFLDLFAKGLLERKHAPTFWDPIDLTAIAQAEIEDKEKQGHMHYIKFLSEAGEDLIIATTRPEMIPACVALLCHPDDVRYNKFVGQNAITPIFGHKVPIIMDEAVDPEKGSGLVMCCTFGDIQDIEWWRKHNLPVKDVINLYGKMQNTETYDGMKVAEARQKIAEDLGSNLLRQEPVTQYVKCAERSGAPLEIIPTHQWYVKVLEHKEQLLEKADECTWYPPYMKVRLDNWVNGLNQDWCISRQRYFGVPFPVWYSKRSGEEGKILLPDVTQLPVDPLSDLPLGYSKDEVEPDRDVMDTWATSSISPQLNSLAITKDLAIDYSRHERLFPFDLRPQAHEIIRTWAFYTLAKSLHHENTIPWKNLMISGWCLAADKTKMSKSKGNVVTPKDLIEEKSADVIRYWASTSKLGVDIAYSEELFKIGKKLVTKLWNASKFCATHLEHIEGTPTSVVEDCARGAIYEDADLWILSCLGHATQIAGKEFAQFEYCNARVAIENFFWNELCDNYLELVKSRAYGNDTSKSQQSAIYTIYHCLHTVLRLLAPIIPFITEELNNILFKDGSIHKRGSWPKLEDHIVDEGKLQQGADMINIVELIRKAKSLSGSSLRAELNFVEYYGAQFSDSWQKDIMGVANAKALRFNAELNVEKMLTSECGKFKVYVEFNDSTDIA